MDCKALEARKFIFEFATDLLAKPPARRLGPVVLIRAANYDEVCAGGPPLALPESDGVGARCLLPGLLVS